MLFLAYFYQKNSVPVEGWRDRLTISCDSKGRAKCPVQYDRISRERWVYIGYYELGKTPDDVWKQARA